MAKKNWKQMVNSNSDTSLVVPFLCGMLCGVVVGLLAVPFSKGIIIGSYNGSSNRVSYESVKELSKKDGENQE